MIGKTIGFGILGGVGGFTIATGVVIVNDNIGSYRYYKKYPERINTTPGPGEVWDTVESKLLDADETQQVVSYLTIGGAIVSAVVGGGLGSAVVRLVKEKMSR